MRRAGPLSDGAALVALLLGLAPGVADPALAAEMGIAAHSDVRRGRHRQKTWRCAWGGWGRADMTDMPAVLEGIRAAPTA